MKIALGEDFRRSAALYSAGEHQQRAIGKAEGVLRLV
jgi:hypothetical protein